MKCAIETALLCFTSRCIPIKAIPHLQLVNPTNSGIGMDAARLKRLYLEFTGLDVLDLDFVKKDWNSKDGKWNPSHPQQVMEEVELYLQGNPQEGRQEIMVISHTSWFSNFLEWYCMTQAPRVSDNY